MLLRAIRWIALGTLAVFAFAPYLAQQSYGVFTTTVTNNELHGSSGSWPNEPVTPTDPDVETNGKKEE